MLSKHVDGINVIPEHTLTDKDYRYAKGKINWLRKQD